MFDRLAKMNANLPNHSVNRTSATLRVAPAGYVQRWEFIA
jgi:hypothetical protein